MKYLDRLSQSADALKSQDMQFQVEQSKLQLASDILSTQKEVSNWTVKVETLKNSFPLNTQAILDAKSQLTAFQNGLVELQAMQEELF